MARQNELPVLVVSLLVTAGLLAGGAWLLRNQLPFGGPSAGPGSTTPGGTPRPTPGSLTDRFSQGERLLTPGAVSDAKQAGIDALASRDYAPAVSSFEAALAQRRNDPEALIYLNNARIGDGQSYAIAVSVPIANLLNPALEMLRGVAQAQTEINQAGGIGGIPLKVIIVSDDNAPDTASQVAAALVDDPDVLGVVGHYSSSTTLAAADTYETGQLVMISPVSTAVSLSQAGDYIFRTVPSDRLAANTLAGHLLGTGRQRAAVFYSSASTYSESLRSEFTTALLSDGGSVVTEYDLSQATFDANQAIQQAQQQGAETLVMLNDVDTLDRALQVIAVNRGTLPLLGGDDLYNPKVLQVGGENALGMVVSVPWHVLSHLGSEFVEASRQLWGGDVSWRTAMAYDAVQTLAAGMAADPTRSGIQQAISATGFEAAGANRPVRYFANGDRNQPAELVEVGVGDRSGFGYDYEPVD